MPCAISTNASEKRRPKLPKANTRLAGHGMRYEGKALYDAEGKPTTTEGGWIYNYASKGSTECECGERSPVLTSDFQRKRWHREHKEQVRAAKAAPRRYACGTERIVFSHAFTIIFPHGTTPEGLPNPIGITNGDYIDVQNGRIIGCGTA